MRCLSFLPSKKLCVLISSCILALAIPSPAQKTLTGRITDWNGNGVTDAVVYLVSAALETKTDYTGYFTFDNSTLARFLQNKAAAVPPVTLRGTMLTYSVISTTVPVRIELFALNGKKIATIQQLASPAGNYSVNLRKWLSTAAVSLLRTTIGNQTITHTITSFGGTGRSISVVPNIAVQKQAVAAKRASSATDSIRITHFGYTTKTLPIADYTTRIDTIKLEYEFRQEGDPAGMVRVPGGVFTQGSDMSEDNEKPAHPSFVSPFYMDTTEVTQLEYEALTNKTPWMKNTRVEELGHGPAFPAWLINFNDAIYACNRKSVKAGLDTVYTYSGVEGEAGNNGVLQNIEIHYDKAGYRLPTEAEWEFACRAGTRTLYYWGTEKDSATMVNYVWSNLNSNSKPHEVAQLLPNKLKLYDMANNCFEWCNDFTSFSYKDTFEIDPIGPATGNRHVLRSLASGDQPYRYSSSRRGGGGADPNTLTDKYGGYGFRMVLPLGPRRE